MTPAAFVTGATGFLGKRLIAELLRTTNLEFYLLARSPASCSVALRCQCPCQSDRVTVIAGDLTQEGLGLPLQIRQQVRESVTEFWHLGALTSFDEARRKETQAVNVEGTKHAISIASECKRLERFYHMSTAYVAGCQNGPIPEGPFPNTLGFKNPYEESKFNGEEVVRRSSLPHAILRPSIIMGDSVTGDCGEETRMMYGYVLGLLRAAMHSFDSVQHFWHHWKNTNGDPTFHPNVSARLVADYDATKNMVTIDDVVSCCIAARNWPTSRSTTFNIVNRKNLTCRQIIAQLQFAMKVSGYSLDPNLPQTLPTKNSIVERVAFRNTRLFWPYTTLPDPDWETGNTDSLGMSRVEMDDRLFHNLVHVFISKLAPQQQYTLK